MVAYNASPLIEAAIKSTYDYVDKIIVIDGSAYGQSIDNTAELALSVGEKVEVIRGKFSKPDGSWDELAQRRVFMDVAERGDDSWTIVQDSDEVYSKDNIERLIGHIKSATKEDRVFQHRYIHFWGDINHVIIGGVWGEPAHIGVFRLTKKMMMTSNVAVGENNDERIGGRVLDDVVCHHYGHAMKFDRRRFKVQEYFKMGLFFDHSKYDGNENEKLNKFLDEWKSEEYEAPLPNIRPYSGTHPESVLPLIGSYFDV